MPAYTPSPHRFLAPKAPSAQTPKPKPHSSLRNAITAPTSKTAPTAANGAQKQTPKVIPAKRFVVNPHRRNLSREENAHSVQQITQAPDTTHTQLTPRPKPRRNFERVESIEEPRSSPSLPAEDNGFGIAQSIERDSTPPPHQEYEEDAEMLFTPTHNHKRRRLSSPSSPIHQRSEPTTPILPHNTTTHRFLVPPPRTPAPFAPTNYQPHTSTSTSTTPLPAPQSASHRPHFILPPAPTSPPKPSKPLPEIFSPSRKTGKYVPGGLASTLQTWIIETANTGFAAQDRAGGILWGREKEDGVKLKVRVTQVSNGNQGRGEEAEVECFPGYVAFVKGTTEPGLYNASRAPSVVGDGGEMRVLLAGQGGARGAGGVRVRVGAVVGVRAPMWEVDVGEEKWQVAVDWVVL